MQLESNMRYEIHVVDREGNVTVAGQLWIDPATAKWGFRSNDPNVTEILRRIRERGYAEQRYSIEVGDTIGEAVHRVTACDEPFLASVGDELSAANVVDLKLLS